ncbi:MAG: hypothetical protein ACTSU5_12495 [Promethearchaeota archaeon]
MAEREKKENKFLKFFEDIDKGFKEFFGIKPRGGQERPVTGSIGGTAPQPSAAEGGEAQKPDFNAFTKQVGSFFQKLKEDADRQVKDWKDKQEQKKAERQQKTKEFFEKARKSWEKTVQKWQDDWKKAGENLEADFERRKAKIKQDWDEWVQSTREDYRQYLKYQSRITGRIMFNIMMVIIPIVIVLAIVLALLSKFTSVL